MCVSPRPYPIPYRVLLPKPGTCNNVFVPEEARVDMVMLMV